MTLACSTSIRLAQNALLRAYGGRVPRYTSYPPATQFSADIDADVYGAWLGAMPSHAPVSLYVHVPYCRRLCWFCGCHSRVVRHAESVRAYVESLRDEIALIEARLPCKLKAGHVHLGGGTPNLLSVDDLRVMFETIRQVFRVPLGAEISAEIDPLHLTEDWVRAARFHGLTRASLGVQDLSPDVQAAVNRHESIEVVADAVRLLRRSGIASLNFDLMYGLPRQSTADVLATIEQILPLAPDRLALFGYAHVPWMKAHQKLIVESELPGAQARLDQSEGAAERLIAAGYRRIGIDHFALPDDSLAHAAADGNLTRGFQGYSGGGTQTLIGIGVSAISRLPQGFAQNRVDELAWRADLARGRLPTARGIALSDQDRLRAEIIGRLMCDFSVDLAAVARDHGQTLAVLCEPLARIDGFVRDGVVRRDGARLTVTAPGRPFVRTVAAAFDDYLIPTATRHAVAV